MPYVYPTQFIRLSHSFPNRLASTRMSKLNAIYAALDSGNPKSALKLCQQVLSKPCSNAQLAKALMGLALSRLDQSDEAIDICRQVVAEGVSDQLVVETLGYVLRRECRFDMYSDLLASPSVITGESSVESARQAFVTCLQAAKYEPLGSLAMKLIKLSNEKQYYAWYAFGLSLSAKDEKIISLALGMIDKAVVSNRSPLGESRHSTCDRQLVYLTLFKLQLLSKQGRWDEVKSLVNGLKDGLVTASEKQQLIREIALFKSNPELKPAIIDDLISSAQSDSLIDRMEALIVRDARAGNNTARWNSDEEYLDFLSLVRQHIETSHARSDCLVTTAPFLALVSKEDAKNIAVIVSSLLSDVVAAAPSKTRATSLISLFKLQYGLDKEEVDLDLLLNIGLDLIAQEHALDECSPGKQLLLLSAIVMLERGQIESALTVLNRGSELFKQCSHFRLVECIVYAILGLTCRALERFEALGIKNAQFRNLWWLMSGIINKNFVAARSHLLRDIEAFFKRNRCETLYNYTAITSELMMYRFSDFATDIKTTDDSAVKAFVARERVLESLTGFTDIPIRDSDEYDFSPVLFIKIPQVASRSTTQYRNELVRRKFLTSRTCGFKWPAELLASLVPESEPSTRISPELIVGKLIARNGEETVEFQQIRFSIGKSVAAVLTGDFASALTEIDHIRFPDALPKITTDWARPGPVDYSWYRVVAGLVKAIAKSKFSDVAEADFEAAIADLIPSLKTQMRETDTRHMGPCLNGCLGWVISLLEKSNEQFSKKSFERRVIKKLVAALNESLETQIQSLSSDPLLRTLPGKTCQLPASLEEHREKLRSRFTNDALVEVKVVSGELERLLDRIKLVKL